MKTYKLTDFIKVDENNMVSSDGLYNIQRDSHGFIYPCEWYYELRPKTKESGNFWCYMVNVSYDYSFTFIGAVEILNLVLSGKWMRGEGRYLNGLKTA